MSAAEEQHARGTATAAPHARARRRGADIVEFVDTNDVRWHVSERDARRDPGARGEWCLVFACADTWRRVWHYPPQWRELSPEALLALSWAR